MNSIRHILLRSLLVVATLCSSVALVTPVMADANNLILESKTVYNGSSFDMNLSVDTSSAIAGAQAFLSFDATKLQCNSADYTGFFGTDEYNVTPVIDNVAGTIQVLASTTGGPTTVTGTGVWAVLNFTAQAAANDSATTVSLVEKNILDETISFVADANANKLATLLVNSNVQVTGNKMALESKVVANGATFSVTLDIATAAQVAGGQASLTFNPAMLQCNSATYFDAPKYFGPDQYNVGVTIANGKINNILGQINGLTSTTGGPTTVTGNGTWVTLSFTALAAADNSFQVITLTPASYVADAVPDPLTTALTPATITVGTPPSPDLTVSQIVATGTDANYTISFRVSNIGNLVAGSSSASITGDLTGSPLTVSIPAINAGSFLVVTSPSIVISGQSDNFVVTVDSSNKINESNEGNNTGSGQYAFVPAPDGQLSDVNGTISGTLSFSQPSAVNFGTMLLGENHEDGILNVKSNRPWQISVASDIVDGKMTKWEIATGNYTAAVKLKNALRVSTTGGYLGTQPEQDDPVNNLVSLTSTPSLLAKGVTDGQVTDPTDETVNLGEDRTLNYDQKVVASDAALSSAYSYHIVVSFNASNTDW